KVVLNSAVNADVTASALSASIGDATGLQNGKVTFNVFLNNPAPKDETFQYSTQNQSAIAGTDYTAVVGQQFTIPKGQDSATITITTLNNTKTKAPFSQFLLNLSAISSGAAPSLMNQPLEDTNYQGWLYALGGGDALYMTKNFGGTWTKINIAIQNGFPTDDETRGQYNPTTGNATSFAIDPNDPNVVYIGGLVNASAS